MDKGSFGCFGGLTPDVAAEEAAAREPAQMMIGERTEEEVSIHNSRSIKNLFRFLIKNKIFYTFIFYSNYYKI